MIDPAFDTFGEERRLVVPVAPVDDAVPLIFAFPNTYAVGITSLGYQMVWATFAQRSDVWVSRLFTDAAETLPRQPELVGFSLSWELDYGNVFDLLEFLKIPLRSSDRTDDHPLVFGGGPVLTANPEPFADFFDLILVGDGEILLNALIEAYHPLRTASRSLQLRGLAQVPGVYVPQLYEVIYHGDFSTPQGTIASIQPIDSQIPERVHKQTYRGNTLSTSAIVTPRAAWENIFMVEVVRSCPEMCRFCLASYLTLPFRTASLEASLIPAIDRGLQVTDRLGLLGASVTQHPEFETLLAYLLQPQYAHVRLSIASVRTNTVTETLAKALAQHGTQSLTIAVESGSERLRQVINKKLETEAILQAVHNAEQSGLQGLKLYGMVGIPTETEADIEATIALMTTLKKAAPKLRLTLGCSTFVPKSHTPFQWYGVNPRSEKRLQQLQKKLRSQGIEFRPESYKWSVIQALISRGDRRLSVLLESVRNYGDSLGSYRRVFKELKAKIPPLDYYVHETWDPDQVLPWSVLQGPIPLETLKKQGITALHLG